VIDGQHIELTTFRTKHPGVYAQTIEADLSLRDFTVNAIGYDIARDTIIDPFGGVADLQRNHLRAVGAAAERFQEDPLRMLRMIRLGAAEGREVDPECLTFVTQHGDLLSGVSIERIRMELEKIVVAPEAAAGVRMLVSSGLAATILPELLPTLGFEQNEFHIHDVFEHTLWVLERAPHELTIRLAALFHDLGKPASFSLGENGERHFYRHEEIGEKICVEAMYRLKFSNEMTKAVSTIVRHHMRPLDCGPSGVRRILRDVGEYYDIWRQIKVADAPPKMTAEEFQARLKQFDDMVHAEFERQKGSVYGKLAVNGEDLKLLGCKPGPGMGALLKYLEELVIETPELNDKTELLRRAQEYLLTPPSR